MACFARSRMTIPKHGAHNHEHALLKPTSWPTLYTHSLRPNWWTLLSSMENRRWGQKRKVKLSLARRTSFSAHPEKGEAVTSTDYCKDHAAFDTWVAHFLARCEILEQIACASSHVTVNGPKSSLQHLCNVCFFQFLNCTPRLFMFPLPPNNDPFMWLFLALVVNPTIPININKGYNYRVLNSPRGPMIIPFNLFLLLLKPN